MVGAPKHWRHTYKLWEEPKAPDFVLEVTSRSTRTVDRGRKRNIYASLGVREYWMFDPTGDWLAPRLQGLRLHAGEYRPLPSVATVDGGLLLRSEALGLDVRLDAGEDLRFRDPVTGRDLPGTLEAQVRYRETQVRYQETQARLEREIEARRAAEARLAELEERLGRS